MKLNHLLFRVAELEEVLESRMAAVTEEEYGILRKRLDRLQYFKYHPIRSHDESHRILWQLDCEFGDLGLQW